MNKVPEDNDADDRLPGQSGAVPVGPVSPMPSTGGRHEAFDRGVVKTEHHDSSRHHGERMKGKAY